jgi:hypothetical protein
VVSEDWAATDAVGAGTGAEDGGGEAGRPQAAKHTATPVATDPRARYRESREDMVTVVERVLQAGVRRESQRRD